MGGGRWAKVLSQVFRQVIDPSDSLDIWTPSNSSNMRAWLESVELPGVGVLSERPRLELYRGALISNRARHHTGCALETLAAGVPTLVEKPLALTVDNIVVMLQEAKNNRCLLYPALVFRFAEYLRRFAGTLEAMPDRVDLAWWDPKSEQRWGEEKTFDPTISVIDDVFPHVYSIISQFCHEPWSLGTAEVSRGGQEVICKFHLGPTTLNLTLARNAVERRRTLEVFAQGQRQKLDFTVEPGTIHSQGSSEVADPNWQRRKSPLTLMLTEFHDAVVYDSPIKSGYTDDQLQSLVSMSEKATTLTHRCLVEWLRAGGGDAFERECAIRELHAYARL